MGFSDTIAAICTPPGSGGVAIVRVSGDAAFSIAEKITRSPVKPGKIVYTSFYAGEEKNAKRLDEGIVLAFKSPHSYTGEDVIEFQCHGGAVTPRRVLEAAFSAGARLAQRGEFTRRAFLNGMMTFDEAEAVIDLINAKTDKAADDALQGLDGSRRKAYEDIYDLALSLSTEIEHSLDVDEGDLPDGFIDGIFCRCASLRKRIEDEIAAVNSRRVLRDGALVVLAGPPNAGKSSLFNALLGQARAIVSDVPGTTRDAIESWIDIDGWPVRLIDTAGVRDTDDAIESQGVALSGDYMKKADVVLCLGKEVSSLFSEALPILVSAKCDISRGEGINVSSVTGEGIQELKKAISAKISERAATDGIGAQRNIESADVLIRALEEIRTIPTDLVLAGNAIRRVCILIGEMVGKVYTENLLDNLFSRFCVGK
jgi:tRNA modification GTPase